MRTFFKMMKKRENAIPEEKLLIFENIINAYFAPGCGGSNEGDNKFIEAIGEHFTEEQRFRLWEQNGACGDFGREKARKAFAVKHANKPLPIKLDLYITEFENGFNGQTRNIVLDEKNNTINVTFACNGCYKRNLDGKHTAPFTIYYERCAGGRLKNLETALGIKLRIKFVDIPPVGVSIENPCVFTFEIAE